MSAGRAGGVVGGADASRRWISEYRPDPSGPDGSPSGNGASTARGPRRLTTSTALTAVQLILCAAAVTVASGAYLPFFGQRSFLWPIAVAAGAGTLCGATILALRRPPGLSWAITVVSYLALCVYLLFPGTTRAGFPSLASLSAVADGLRHGVARMLTIAPPADVEPQLLIAPVTIAFLAGVSAAVLVPRRAVLLPLLPPLVAFVVALLLSANVAAFQWQVTAGFLACCFAVVLLRASRAASAADQGRAAPAASPPGPRAIWSGTAGKVLLGVPLLAVVVASATAAAGFLPVASGASRFDLRELREPPLVLQDELNPLVDLRRQIQAPSTETAFTISTRDGQPLPVDRIRVAALDDYDGVQFTSGSVFVRTGSTLPAAAVPADPASATVEVTLTGAVGPPFIPEFGVPQRVQADNLGYDRSTGLLVTGDRSLDGYHYELTTQYPATPIDPATATRAQGPEFDRWLRLPQGIDGDPGAGLAALARKVTAGEGSDWAKLQRLADQLKASAYALNAAPGHSYAALQRFLEDAPASADRRVTEEQTVPAFVIMARSLGYPARVAVGYRVDPADASGGTYTVPVRDADAWAEVAFAGQGWVPFSTTAPREGQPPPPPPAPPGNDQGPPATVDPGTIGPEVATGAPAGIGIGWALVLTIVIPILVIGLIVGAVLAAKHVRRRRRSTRGTTAARIVGAWRESTNRLRESGFAVPAALTPSEAGRRVAERFGSEAGTSVTAMSPLVSAAVYAPELPDEEAVVRAWDLEAELRAILDGRRSFAGRLRALIDPRPLLPNRRAGRSADESGDATGSGPT